jgi:FKBP-type peptidyl-prolyl cis-trans isomerase FkpA
MRIKTLFKLTLGIAVLGGGAWFAEREGLIKLPFDAQSAQPAREETAQAPQSFHEKFETALKDLKIEDTKLGSGDIAESGKPLKIHYVARIAESGQEFDSSVSRKDPLVFTLGQAQALPGLDRGIVGMKVGGKRRLTIPSFLGYGENGVGTLVPPNATLVFDVELLAVGSERSRGKVARAEKTEKKVLSKERRPAKSRSKPHRRA